MSDMDSECDDVFTEDSKSYCGSGDNKSISGTEDDGRHMMNRKRRRGIIEKRRRDRINNSLSELRRLVPAAFEKQGSAKLEKAEILQMTVEHLKLLHSKGVDVFSSEPYKLITDYHGIGFRECASEVARYLVGFEGMDLQDPLRLRLLSHLQCYSAQRDALTTSHPTARIHYPWYTSLPAVPTPQYPQLQSRSSISDLSIYSSSSRSERRPSSASSMMSVDSRTNSTGSPRGRPQIPISPIALNPSSLLGGFSRPPVTLSDSSPQTPPIKPYRPWGTELAY